MITTNIGINLEKKNNPFEHYYDLLDITLSKGIHKKLVIKIKQQKLITDDGWFIKNKKEEKAYSLDVFYFDFSTEAQEILNNDTEENLEEKGSEEMVWTMNISPSKNEEVIKRIYQKLHNAVADVRGILSILLNLMPLLNYCFSKIKIDEVILNSLFDFDFSNKPIHTVEMSMKLQNNNSTKRSNINLNNTLVSQGLKPSRKSEKIRRHQNDVNTKIAKLIEIKKGKNKKKLEFTFIEILFGCCLKSKQSIIKRKLYKKSQQTVRNYLEISYIITKLDDLSKIQYAIFSKEQTALFRFISKNLCSIDENKMKNNPINKYRDRFNNDKEMASIYLSYKEALCNGEIFKTRIDDRLMILLNEEIKDNQHYYNIEE